MSVSHKETSLSNTDLPEDIQESVLAAMVDISRASSLGEMVMAALVGLRRVGLQMVRHVLTQRDQPFRKMQATVWCRDCKTPMEKQKKLKKRGRWSLLGKLWHWRCRYACPKCGRRVFPLDESLGLKSALRGHGEEFAKRLVLLCVVVPFGKGCDLFSRLCGIEVSTKLARALTFTLGTRLFEAEMARAEGLWKERYERPELFEPPPAQLRKMKRHRRVYVMTDNSKVGVQEGKRGRNAPKVKTLLKMAKQAKRKTIQAAKRKKHSSQPPPKLAEDLEALLEEDEESWRDIRALLIFSDKDLAQTSKNRRQILRRRVIGHVGTKEEWIRLVHMAFHEEGVYTAREVVVVADGGAGIWELMSELLPSTEQRKVIQILDWYHAVKKLWTVGRALKGYKTKAQRKACELWVRALLDYLAEGKVSNVLQRLRKIRKVPDGAKATLENGIKYFENHRQRMHYRNFRNQGLIIGSGAIESVHAWVFQARCRLPGMRWSVKGANAIIRLRCSWASGRWDDDFAQAANAPPLSNRDLKAAT